MISAPGLCSFISFRARNILNQRFSPPRTIFFSFCPWTILFHKSPPQDYFLSKVWTGLFQLKCLRPRTSVWTEHRHPPLWSSICGLSYPPSAATPPRSSAVGVLRSSPSSASAAARAEDIAAISAMFMYTGCGTTANKPRVNKQTNKQTNKYCPSLQ